MRLDDLNKMIAEDAAIRRMQVLQPMSGSGGKIYPPTYSAEKKIKTGNKEDDSGGNHVFEQRRLDGELKWCVVIDSWQSQANRMEEGLLKAVNEGIPIPHAVVEFSKVDENWPDMTSLDASHRIYDAYFRYGQLNGEAFMESDIGKRLANAFPGNAAALLEVSPNALLFGAWHSTGKNHAGRFARCLESEIYGVDVPVNENGGTFAVETTCGHIGSRIDPFNITKENVEGYVVNEETKKIRLLGEGEKKATGEKVLVPADINLGMIPPDASPRGITCDHIKHSFVLNLAALRQLRFGGGGKDAAGRNLVAALGLLALAEQDKRGYALRSCCGLVCDRHGKLELLHWNGKTDELPAMDPEDARVLYKQAFEAAQQAGLKLNEKPLRLAPNDEIVDIIRKSNQWMMDDGEQS